MQAGEACRLLRAAAPDAVLVALTAAASDGRPGPSSHGIVVSEPFPACSTSSSGSRVPHSVCLRITASSSQAAALLASPVVRLPAPWPADQPPAQLVRQPTEQLAYLTGAPPSIPEGPLSAELRRRFPGILRARRDTVGGLASERFVLALAPGAAVPHHISFDLPRQGNASALKGDPCLASNYRPITLLNTDYRLLSKVLAHRLGRCLPSLISPEQAAFLRGRSIGENAHLLQLLPHLLARHGRWALVAFCDFRKAYDTVHRGFLLAVLRQLGLGDGFVSWVQLLLPHTLAAAAVNRCVSRPALFLAGVRQGCPLAPLLYLCLAQALLRLLQARGVGIQAAGLNLAALQLADDCEALLEGGTPQQTADRVQSFLAAMATFAAASGQHLAPEKTHLLPIGSQPPAPLPPAIHGLQVVPTAEALGLQFHAGTQPATANWQPRLQRVEAAHEKLASLGLLAFGRGFGSAAYGVSQLLYCSPQSAAWPLCASSATQMTENARALHAVVLGATGAVGREVVGHLLASPRWGSVTAVGRRAVEPPAAYKSQPGYDASKLKQAVVDMDNLEEEAAPAFAGADSVFCCLGTTRSAAGTAAAFKKVDLDYVAAGSRAAAAGGVPHFALVSAQGAKAGVWASNLKIFHGLLYMQTKGQAEEAVKAGNFAYASIWRPGLLERGDLARGPENLYAKLVSSVASSQVAAAMVGDAERWHDARRSGSGAAPPVKTFEMADIQQWK
ncbi:Oxidoreductase HTATIP2 [Micractinium conductrix]|uniref:Oxidoreductase HTATIP2 n=1 Tax=Micractinium conductrix TaxID=554055 RepID=A0A2P6V5Z4_9CHLO|nr:Oxidoreductase HTATIP2 [Micractinium conductrix]|eukprot:PSC69508.1 Oxidoreductase HTATIP2 [Micractinium conductrix]